MTHHSLMSARVPHQTHTSRLVLDSKDYELPKIPTTACLTVSRRWSHNIISACLSLRRSYSGSSEIGTITPNAGWKPLTGFWSERTACSDRCHRYPTRNVFVRRRSATFNAANTPRHPRSFAAVRPRMRQLTMSRY